MLTSVATSHTLLRDMLDESRKEAAWQGFCNLYQAPIRRWCLGQCRRHGKPGHVAHAVVQAVLVRLYSKLATYDPRRRFRPWLHAVIKSVYFDHLRDLKKSDRERPVGGCDHLELLDKLSDPHPWEMLVDALESSVDPYRRQALKQICSTVEKPTWRAFYLLVAKGKNGAEVAARLGMTIGAVHQAKYRVRQLVQQEYERILQAVLQDSSR